MTWSRLGLHIIQPASGHVAEIERAAQAGVPLRLVKCVDFPGLIPEVLRVSPSTLVMWRATGLDNPDGGEYRDDQDLDALAERLLAHHLGRLGSYANLASRIILEVLNEPDPPTPAGYRNLGRLMILLMQKASARGLTIAAPAMNYGTPATWEKLDAFVSTGVFQVAHDLGQWITFHEGVDRGWEVNRAWGDAMPGFPFRLENASPYNFRYRYAVEVARRQGQALPNMAITEWYSGSNTPAEQVVADVAWYDQRVREDPYAFVFMLFTHGANSNWAHSERDYDPCLHALIDYVIAEGPEAEKREMIAFNANTEEELKRGIAKWEAEGFRLTRQRIVHVAEMEEAPEPPVRPWWELLPEPTPPGPSAPRAKIFAVENHLTHVSTVPIYRSAEAGKPPSFTDLDTRTKKRGEPMEVWHAVVPGSGWICVFDGNLVGGALTGTVLWAWADDVAKDPPPALAS